jgi:hypothetical protein
LDSGIGRLDGELVPLNDCWIYKEATWYQLSVDQSIPRCFGCPVINLGKEMYILIGRLHSKGMIRIGKKVELVERESIFYYDTPDEIYNDVLFSNAIPTESGILLYSGKSNFDTTTWLKTKTLKDLLEYFE